jgi:hypothetical protein
VVLELNTRISERQVYALVARDLERLLGVHGIDEESADLAAFDGGSIFDFSSKVVGVISTRRRSTTTMSRLYHWHSFLYYRFITVILLKFDASDLRT